MRKVEFSKVSVPTLYPDFTCRKPIDIYRKLILDICNVELNKKYFLLYYTNSNLSKKKKKKKKSNLLEFQKDIKTRFTLFNLNLRSKGHIPPRVFYQILR